MKRHKRYGDHVYRDRRWPALRLLAKRRDNFQCVKCGSRHRLEVDHIEPVRDAPEKAFDLNNLQCLCPSCHTRKSRIEAGHPELSPERRAWRDLLQGKQRSTVEHRRKSDA